MRVKPSDLGLSIFIFNLCLFYVQRYSFYLLNILEKINEMIITLHTKSLQYCCVMSDGGQGEGRGGRGRISVLEG